MCEEQYIYDKNTQVASITLKVTDNKDIDMACNILYRHLKERGMDVYEEICKEI
jgi:hypothetical protein